MTLRTTTLPKLTQQLLQLALLSACLLAVACGPLPAPTRPFVAKEAIEHFRGPENVKRLLEILWRGYLSSSEEELAVKNSMLSPLMRLISDQMLADQMLRAQVVIEHYLAKEYEQPVRDLKMLQPEKWELFVLGDGLDERLATLALELDENQYASEEEKISKIREFETLRHQLMGLQRMEVEVSVENLDFSSM